MSDYKVNLVDNEELSASEKEKEVLQNAGINVGVDDGVYKVNLKEKKDAVQEQSTDEGVLRAEQPEVELQEVGEGNKELEITSEQEEQVIELIQEEKQEEKNEEFLQQTENETTSIEGKQTEDVREEKIILPENIQKLVDFMNETGGTLEDYVRLNVDYSNISESSLLKEYYKQTKPHLDNEEIDFLIEDSFSFDEDLDEQKDIRRKKLAYKEEISKAKRFLGDLKSKYYDEIKLNSRLTENQKEAIDFYNQYKQQQSELTAVQQKASDIFTEKTNSFFNEEFKGFEFKVGENKYRYKVNDPGTVKQAQNNIVKTFEKFLDDKGVLGDAAGFHKALFAARNADAIANHFYEQGKADALKQLNAESKNINMDPRKTSNGVIDVGGLKVRAITGDDSSKLRVKIKQ